MDEISAEACTERWQGAKYCQYFWDLLLTALKGFFRHKFALLYVSMHNCIWTPSENDWTSGKFGKEVK